MKTPLFRLQYELDRPYTEKGSDAGAKLYTDLVDDEEVRRCLLATEHMGHKAMIKWFDSQHNLSERIVILPLTTHTPESLQFRLEGRSPKLLFVARPLHTIEMLDEFLFAANHAMEQGGWLSCHTMTAVLKRQIVNKRYPWGIRNIVIGVNYLWHHICPKLKLTRNFYFTITQGKNRSFNRVEILGRLSRAGFEIMDEQFREGEFFVLARKVQEPIDDIAPTGSPIIHLRRVGLGGKEIVVHKFRTMYSYSEYIQQYVYQYQHLQSGGKFKDDYRVNFWGRLLRRTWLDELPMLWNILQGDIKLVGVRPLSHQYFNLYTPEMQALRTKTKPGLLPPFYYEAKTPETLDEVQESERRYLEAYLQHPFRTDWRYFWGIVRNILFNKKHSA